MEEDYLIEFLENMNNEISVNLLTIYYLQRNKNQQILSLTDKFKETMKIGDVDYLLSLLIKNYNLSNNNKYKGN